MEPERIELYYTVRHFDPIRKKWSNTRWKMTESAAAEYFADQEYEILRGTKEERRVGGDLLRNSMARFYRGKE